MSLEKAVLESSQTNQQPLKELNNKLNSLIAIATKILKGKFPKSDTHLDSSDLPDGEEDNSGSKEEGGGLHEESVRGRRGVMARHQVHKLQTVLLVLSQYRQCVSSLTKHVTDFSSTGVLSKSFLWQSMLHYHWSSQEQSCQLSTLHASLPYGYHFTGSASHIVLAPETEKAMLFLLRAITQGTNTLLTGPQVGLPSLPPFLPQFTTSFLPFSPSSLPPLPPSLSPFFLSYIYPTIHSFLLP